MRHLVRRHSVSYSVLLTLIVIWTHCSAYGQGAHSPESWKRFRGSNGTGVSEATTIPTNWAPADYKWRILLPGTGSSSPVVDGDQLFITCGLDDGTRSIRCLQPSDGSLIWNKTFSGNKARMHSTNNYAPSTPAIDDDRVYMMWGGNDEFIVLALTRERGEVVWRRDLGTFETVHGFGTSPMLFGDMVIVSCDHDGQSFVEALDRKTGETVWKSLRKSEEAGYATPMIYTPEGGQPQIVCGSWAHGVFALDPKDGKELWSGPAMGFRMVASPVYAGGLFFVSGGKGGVGRQMVAVRPGDPANGKKAELAHEFDGDMPYVPTSVAHNDMLFTWWDKGTVRCFDAATCKELGSRRIGGVFYGSPVCVNGYLYCVSRRGEMYVIKATPELEEVAKIDLEEPSDTTPAVADGVMYIRTKSHLMAIGGE